MTNELLKDLRFESVENFYDHKYIYFQSLCKLTDCPEVVGCELEIELDNDNRIVSTAIADTIYDPETEIYEDVDWRNIALSTDELKTLLDRMSPRITNLPVYDYDGNKLN